MAEKVWLKRINKMKKLLIIVLLFVGCGGREWSKSDKIEFMYECVDNKARDQRRCECVLYCLQKKHWSLARYHSDTYNSVKGINWVDDPEGSKRIKAKLERNQKEHKDCVTDCLRGY